MIQKNLRNFVNSLIFHYFFATFTLVSTINFSLEGILSDESYNEFNTTSTIFFTFELFFKLIGLGLLDYIRSKQNIIDLIITIYMIMYNLTNEIEIITSQIPSFRLVRAFVIFRAFKIFKGISFFDVIEYVIKKSFYSFFYIAMLILVFLIVLAMIGYQLFLYLLNDEQFTMSAKSFKGFFPSFMTVFDIMTLDNYSQIFYESWNKAENFYLIAFFVVIIFAGNMFLLNLFITVLLNGFEKLSQQEKEEQERESFVTFQTNYEEEDLNESSYNFSNNLSINSEFSSKKTPIVRTKSMNNEESLKPKKTISILNDMYGKIDEEISLFIFSKNNLIRRICFKMTNNKIFKILINFTIIFSVLYLAGLTFYPSIDKGIIGFWIKIIINSIMILESTALIINNGFIMRKKSYMRNIFNVIDLAVIFIFFLDVLTDVPESINVFYSFLSYFNFFNR